MKRVKASKRTPAYPSLERVLREPGAAVGMLVLVAATPVLQACPLGGVIGGHVDGDIAIPEYDIEVILPADEARVLFMADGGHVAYRIIAQISDPDLASYLLGTRVDHLADIDDVLDAHSVWELAPGEDLAAVEAEIAQALADAYYGGERAPTYAFNELILSIEAWDSGEIDGDMPEPAP